MVEAQRTLFESFIYPTPHNYSSSSNGVDLRAHNYLEPTKMGAIRINFAALAFLVVLATSAVGKTSAATYVVRDSAGWGIPTSGGAASYTAWASQHTFHVGDHLVFNFPTGAHDVAIVSKASYDGCLSSSPISLVTVGPATVNLSSPGEAYFICTFSQHCSLGQQLAINVSSGTTPPTPPTTTPPTSPPPAATPPPSTSPPTTTPPPPTSPPTTTPPPSTSPPTTTPAPVPAPAKPGPAAPVPAPAKPGPAAPVPAPAKPGPAAPAPAPGTGAPTPGTSGPSPAPGPGGAASSPPSVSPSPSPGGGASTPEASPPPGESPSPPAPPPNAAPPASVTATATIFVMFMSLAVVIFF